MAAIIAAKKLKRQTTATFLFKKKKLTETVNRLLKRLATGFISIDRLINRSTFLSKHCIMWLKPSAFRLIWFYKKSCCNRLNLTVAAAAAFCQEELQPHTHIAAVISAHHHPEVRHGHQCPAVSGLMGWHAPQRTGLCLVPPFCGPSPALLHWRAAYHLSGPFIVYVIAHLLCILPLPPTAGRWIVPCMHEICCKCKSTTELNCNH